ncbi:MAG: family 10 glycosylhydrolase [Candidatus Dormibacteraeota bacterium]|nr:family 10 glycosylhydrolase [Candidatus Dormibacteraeota bacterium]
MSRSRALLVSLLLIASAACSVPAGPAAAQSPAPSGSAAHRASAAPEPVPTAIPAVVAMDPVIHPDAAPEYRALWVDGFHQGFKSPQQVDTLIARALKGNLNALFVQVRKRGDAYFLRGVEPTATDISYPNHPSWDPLAYLIQKAHTANPPIEVHAWMNTFFVGQTSEVFQDNADWGNLKASGSNEGYGYLDPGVPAVRAYTQEVMLQVVRHYNVDGIHLDFVRYPDGGDWGYTKISLDLFNQATGRSGRPDPSDASWQQWRRDQVTAFVQGLHDAIQKVRPRVKLSGALIAYGNGPTSDAEFQSTRTYNDVYQDWPTWFRRGYLDIGVPMNYDRDSSPSQSKWFRAWTAWEKDLAKGHLLVGIGAFLNYPEDSFTQIRDALARSAAGNKPLGVAIYSYASTSVYGTDDFYLAPNDQGYLPRQPYTTNTDPQYLFNRAVQFNEWFFSALSAPTTYQDPALGTVATTPIYLKPAPIP